MSHVLYPATLPGPSAAPITSTERRLLSQDPFESRTVQQDRMAVQQVTFAPCNATQAARFDSWWREDLVFGGAWFGADWPLPEGMVTGVRRFIGTPKWQFIPSGYWRISATFEVRGRGLVPVVYQGLWLSLQGETFPYRCRRSDTNPKGPWIDVETLNYAVMCPAAGLAYDGFGNCSGGSVEYETLPVLDSSPHERTVYTVPSNAGSTTPLYAYAGSRSITELGFVGQHLETDQLPIERGLWTIQVALRLGFAGPLPLVFQGADLSASDATERNVIDFYAVPHSVGGDNGFDFIASGYANTTEAWHLEHHVAAGAEWVLLRIERDNVDGTSAGVARMFLDDVLVDSVTCPQGTGGLPYPVLRDSLWIGKRGRVIPTTFQGTFDALTIETAG